MNLKCGKKKNVIIIIIGIVTVAICITAAVLVSRAKKKAAAAQFVPETETYSEKSEEALIEEETVSETASETAPIVKPVGTTAPWAMPNDDITKLRKTKRDSSVSAG